MGHAYQCTHLHALMSLRWAATTPIYDALHRRESSRNRVTVYYGACLTQGRNPMIKRETKGCPWRRIELQARDYAREGFQETSENLRFREIMSRVLFKAESLEPSGEHIYRIVMHRIHKENTVCTLLYMYTRSNFIETPDTPLSLSLSLSHLSHWFRFYA